MLGGYAKICWGVEKCLGGMPTNFVYGFEKKKFLPKYFTDLKNVEGGGVCQQIYGLEKCLGGVMPKYFRDLKKNVGGGGVMPKYFRL